MQKNKVKKFNYKNFAAKLKQLHAAGRRLLPTKLGRILATM
jgi:hypothetical protein